MPVPPQATDHPSLELASPGERPVGGVAGTLQPGVLPGRDPQGEEVALCRQDPLLDLGGGERWHQSLDEVGGALLQGAHRIAGVVALDAAVGRVRGVAVDAGPVHGHAVDPAGMAVAVRKEHRAVRHHGVQSCGGGDAPGEGRDRPPAAHDPWQVAVGCGVGLDSSQVFVDPGEVQQVALVHGRPGEERVDVGVLEPGEDQPAAEVDHFGPGRGRRPNFALAPHRRHPVALHQQRLGDRAPRLHRVHSASDEGDLVGHVAFTSAPSRSAPSMARAEQWSSQAPPPARACSQRGSLAPGWRYPNRFAICSPQVPSATWSPSTRTGLPMSR